MGLELIHYYVAYSNADSGQGHLQGAMRVSGTEGAPAAISPAEDGAGWIKQRGMSWAALVRFIYEVSSFMCRCGATMHIIAAISASERPEVVERILKCVGYRFDLLHLGARPPGPRPEPEPSESTSDDYFM